MWEVAEIRVNRVVSNKQLATKREALDYLVLRYGIDTTQARMPNNRARLVAKIGRTYNVEVGL